MPDFFCTQLCSVCLCIVLFCCNTKRLFFGSKVPLAAYSVNFNGIAFKQVVGTNQLKRLIWWETAPKEGSCSVVWNILLSGDDKCLN